MKHSSLSKATSSPSTVKLRKTALKAFLLHFLANVNLAADAEAALESHGLSRLHNRVLTLAAMNPGVTIGELLRTMRVTHQNLNPTMRLLIKQGLIVAKIGEEDRRQKRLYPTARGRQLVRTVLRKQLSRLERALASSGGDATAAFLDVHMRIIDKEDLSWADRLSQDPSGLAEG